MFSECSSLIFLPDISNWLNYNIKIDYIPKVNKDYQFKLHSLDPLFDYKNYKNLGKNLSYLFYNCSKLEILPDILKWNIIDVDERIIFRLF